MTLWQKFLSFFRKDDSSESPDGCRHGGCKHSLHIGINDYPGTRNDLRGCVNDANNWQRLLKEKYGFKTTVLLDSEATYSKVVREMKRVIKHASKGGHVVITYSGHGTNVRDTSGDEADKRDEALCLYDKLLIDDELRAIFDTVPKGVSLTFISDSCHSGTVTRSFLETMYDEECYSKARYLPPEDDEEVLEVAPKSISKKIFSSEKMNEVLITGCNATQYSYDARISNQFQGAMSANAIAVLKENPEITYDDFYKKLRERLPSRNYPQTPQLEGSAHNRDRIMFS